MSEHLTREQIERYVARRAGVDEILATAEHLDECFDCRDRAAALVDDGSGDLGHVRPKRSAPARQVRSLLPWVIGVVVLAAAVFVWFTVR